MDDEYVLRYRCRNFAEYKIREEGLYYVKSWTQVENRPKQFANLFNGTIFPVML